MIEMFEKNGTPVPLRFHQFGPIHVIGECNKAQFTHNVLNMSQGQSMVIASCEAQDIRIAQGHTPQDGKIVVDFDKRTLVVDGMYFGRPLIAANAPRRHRNRFVRAWRAAWFWLGRKALRLARAE